MSLPGDIEVEEALDTLRQIRQETCDPEDGVPRARMVDGATFALHSPEMNDYELLMEAERTVRAIYKRVRLSGAYE